ncbi:flavin reductase family protein [Longimicrobium sp.]|uniref:flavin reductase family protein n=1 Tax=Longimicrobium sp. TaxID=2029185 RepID=UPI003B3A054C
MSPRPIQPTIHTHAHGPDDDDAALRDAFREALSGWASGVAVVAVREDDEVVAMTVSAFASVSMYPPLVLVCIDENGHILPSMLAERRFTVSLLGEAQKRLAASFADKLPAADDLFAEGDPVLHGSVAALICTLWEAYPGGDHRIVVGRVERAVAGEEDAPLVYHRRRYRGLSG